MKQIQNLCKNFLFIKLSFENILNKKLHLMYYALVHVFIFKK